MKDTENKVTTSEYELAEKIYELRVRKSHAPEEQIAHLIHTHNERQQEVISKALMHLEGIEPTAIENEDCQCNLCASKRLLNQLLQ